MQSIWSESCKFRKREVLDKDIKTDTINYWSRYGRNINRIHAKTKWYRCNFN